MSLTDTTIGKTIAKYRKQKNLTQKELAKKCECATGTIQQYELGKRKVSIEKLKIIANALEVDTQTLIQDNTMSAINKAIFDEVSAYSKLSETDKKQLLEKFNLKKQFEDDFSTDIEHDMIKLFSSLNEKGQTKAIEQIELLAKIPEYQADNGKPEGNK